MKSQLLRGVAVLALTVAGTATVAAQTQPPSRDTRPARAGENYDPVGMPLGSFRLFPALEVQNSYKDNIYAQHVSRGQQGSLVHVFKPSLDLRSNWNNHMLNFYANGGIGLYTASSTENFQDFGVGTNGRFDIQRDWNVYAGGSFNRRHEDRTSPNALTGGNNPVRYNQLAANAGYFQKFNRFSARLDGDRPPSSGPDGMLVQSWPLR